MVTVAELVQKLSDARKPRFVSRGKVIPLRHTLMRGASASQLEWLRHQSRGVSDALLEFYGLTNGARLFANERDAEECFFFLPIGDMDAEKKGLESWMTPRAEEPDYKFNEELSDDGQLTVFGLPPWWNSVLVFAGIGYAPERYFLATDGPRQGNVFVYVHDGDYSVRTHVSFENMIEEICTQPAKFMSWAVNYDIERYESDAY